MLSLSPLSPERVQSPLDLLVPDLGRRLPQDVPAPQRVQPAQHVPAAQGVLGCNSIDI